MNKYAVKCYAFYAQYSLYRLGINILCLFYSVDLSEIFANIKACPLILCAKEMLEITESIVIAIIAMLGTCAGSFGGIITASKLTNFRLEKLEAKVDKHNNFAERMPVVEEKLKVLNHRIEDLEREKNEYEIYKRNI